MTDQEIQDLKLKKGDDLTEALHRCLNQEPELTLKDIAVILHFEMDDQFAEFLTLYKKELKKSV